MKILYAAGLSPKESSLYRLWALERLGHQVIPFNTFDYLSRNRLVRKVTFRLSAGPTVNRLNRELLRIAAAEKPDLVWADKLLSMRPATLDRLRAMGIATVSYMIDNPFGPRQRPRLAALHEGHSSLRSPRRTARQEHPRLHLPRRPQRHQDPDGLRAHPALSPATRVVRRRPQPRSLLHRHAI